MACRIHNLGKYRLALDLRGGEVVYVEPNQISPPLREESLYDNVHLPKWLRQGVVRQIDAKMAEVEDYETGAAPAVVKQAKRRTPAKDKPDAGAAKDDKETEAADASDKGTDKKPKSKPA